MPSAPRLIEVALPLDAINKASAREKSIRHGHPSTLHLWWARRPLAAARAVLFTSLVPDPDPDNPAVPRPFVEACLRLPLGDYSKVKDTPRNRLFDFIATLVTWEATTDEQVISQARELISLGCEGEPPPVLDPFAGGGSIPLEAQRLGLSAHASDLNPVAVLINKAMIEIPPMFAGHAPVNPRDHKPGTGGDARWKGAAGLAADVRYYGEWMRERAQERIGHLYPQHKGETVIAWLWARTVQSPNPAVRAEVPLVNSFALSKKKGREFWAEPIIETLDGADGSLSRERRSEQGPTHRVRFEVCKGLPPKDYQGTMIRRKGAICAVSRVPITYDYIKKEGVAGRIGHQLIAIVTEGKNGRNYHSPDESHVEIAQSAKPKWRPEGSMPKKALGFVIQLYGYDEFHKLFTDRQLVALTTFSDLVAEVRQQVEKDAIAAGLVDDGWNLRDMPESATGADFNFKERSGAERSQGEGEGEGDLRLPQHLGRSGSGKAHDDMQLGCQPGQHPGHLRASGHPDGMGLRGGESLQPLDWQLDSAHHLDHESGGDLTRRPAGSGPSAGRGQAGTYAEAVSVYLAFAVSRAADRLSTICRWDAGYVKVSNTFTRQAIPMVWSYAESNPFSASTGNWTAHINWIAKSIATLPAGPQGHATQQNATSAPAPTRRL